MKIASVKTKLTLWNVGVLALTLTVLGVTIYLGARARLLQAVDKEMLSRAQRTATRIKTVNYDPKPPKLRVLMIGTPSALVDAKLQGNSDAPESIHIKETSPGKYEGEYAFTPPTNNDPTRNPIRQRLLDLAGVSFTGEGPFSKKGFEDAKAGKQTFVETTFEKEPIRVLSMPLMVDGKVVKVLQYPHPLTETYHALSGLTSILVTMIPLVVLAAALGGFFLTDRALRPVRQVTQTASKVSAESLDGRLEVKGNDEFARLAQTFNGMLDRLQGAFGRMEQAVEQQRRFTADASHELRTPLTVIKANTSLAKKGERSVEEYKRVIASVDDAATTMNRLVGDLLALARSDDGRVEHQKEELCLRDVLNAAVKSVSRPGSAPIALKMKDRGLLLEGDAHSLVRVFVNLLENAERHTPEDGKITVTAEDAGDQLLISVRDTGCGIPAEHLPHLCERFYRVDTSRARSQGGNGLGLSICATILEQHGGNMLISSVEGRGTIVNVRLPKLESTEQLSDA